MLEKKSDTSGENRKRTPVALSSPESERIRKNEELTRDEIEAGRHRYALNDMAVYLMWASLSGLS